jgi:hypothetical protein
MHALACRTTALQNPQEEASLPKELGLLLTYMQASRTCSQSSDLSFVAGSSGSGGAGAAGPTCASSCALEKNTCLWQASFDQDMDISNITSDWQELALIHHLQHHLMCHHLLYLQLQAWTVVQ